MMKPTLTSLILLFFATSTAACSDDGGSSNTVDGGSSTSGTGAGASNGTGPVIPGSDGSGTVPGGGGSASPTTMGPYTLPDGYTAGDLGGWKVLGELGGDGPDPDIDVGGGEDGCGTEIIGIVRDFRRGDREDGHPDFETYGGDDIEYGIVEDDLGADKKPVYVQGAPDTTSKADFDQWYRNTDGTNIAFLTAFSFEPNNGVLTFQSNAFFPIDDMGFGNEGSPYGHNFHFTTEIHTEFLYQGGETFQFIGDDDVWVFINGKLALDLGGLHPELSDTVNLDGMAAELGIEIGNEYPLDLFHAERHQDASNFRVDTTLEFTNCAIVVDPILK